MGEKLPYYCRVKKILAALKNGPKLARPVVKWALEKLSLCLSFLIMLMDWLLAPVLISVSRDIDCQHVTVHCAMPLCTALCHYVNITIFCTFHRCTTLSACTLLKCTAQLVYQWTRQPQSLLKVTTTACPAVATLIIIVILIAYLL